MKKPLLSAIAATLMIAGAAKAQVQIVSSGFATLNDTIITAVDSFPSVDVGIAGMQTWDFSNLTIQTYDTLFFIDKTGVAGEAFFAESNMVIANSVQNLFATGSSDGVEVDGFYGDPFGLGQDMDMVFAPSMSMISFPANYLDTDQDAVKMQKGMNLNNDFGFDGSMFGIDSVRFTRDINSTIDYNAYGTLTLPSGDYETIKQYVVETTVDSIFTKTNGVWGLTAPSLLAIIGLTENVIVDTNYIHKWFSDTEKYAVCEVKFDSLNSALPISVNHILGGNVVGVVNYESNASCGLTCNGAAEVAGIGGTGVVSYLWENGATTQAVSDLCPGEYSVTVSDENSTQNIVSVVIGENPTFWSASTNNTFVTCVGCDDGTVTTTTSGGSAPFVYVWNDGVSTTATISGLAPGDYSVTVTDANECMSSSTETVVVDPFLSIEGVVNTVSNIYPNPASSVLNIVSEEAITKVEIIDLLGKTVVSNINLVSKLDVSNLDEGIYLVNIYHKQGVETRKITIKK